MNQRMQENFQNMVIKQPKRGAAETMESILLAGCKGNAVSYLRENSVCLNI